uniref:ATP synthase complex subunit 8 n=1 Tax=Dorcadia ioffi TaxID=2040515 RepID=A0A343KGE9_9NEOP|nr:ATP synthase F0 subunit 8 [Dorcadia ioffi]ATF28031.1 ATP synthase F0 subunit 8 [Dorcadia ioffi]
MPQMAPMLWLLLFIFFICVYLLFLIKNYYSYSIKVNQFITINKMTKKFFNWKW